MWCERGGERTGLQDSYTVVLEHVQKCCLSGIVKTEEEQLCVLVGKAKGGEKVVDWVGISASCAMRRCCGALRATWRLGIHTPMET